MEIIQSVFLGFIQGASEFLPISSSGHLIIAPWIFSWKDPGLAFDVALHFGTLLAVIAYFWKEWMIIFKLAFKKGYKLPAYRTGRQTTCLPDRQANYKLQSNFLWIIIIATIPGVLAGLFLENLAETVFRNPLLIAFNLFFWGLILFLADGHFKHSRNLKKINFMDGILIGLAQALAIVPGTSRSGITITAGLARGLDRVTSARFSFLMLTPIVFGASLLKFEELISGFDLAMALGIICSAISGYLAIKYLIKFVEKSNYKIFFWYRLALATLIIIFYATIKR
ncbi:undecaprenyl-diphosphate phosphatase [bacterium]|nr:undecaprenyl-diphosphate phosphatase [bacterium]